MDELFTTLKKYNFWSGERPKIGIKRSVYLERFKGAIGNPLIKVCVGQRRAGKSYLMRQIIDMLLDTGVVPQHIFYLNKELVEFDAIRTYTDLMGLIEHYRTVWDIVATEKVYIFLDEVQEIDGWEKAVNSLSQDYKFSYEVFVTGSNSTMFSGELATLLSGRYISFEVFPFSYQEYCNAHTLPIGKDSYLSFLETGGLPELTRLTDEETRRQYIQSVKDTILLHDVVARFAIKDPVLLEDVFFYCIQNIGNLLSVNNIVTYAKHHGRSVGHDTISLYLSYVCDVFLLHEVSRYDIRGHSLFVRQKKYYVNDLSFRTFLSSQYDPAPGKLLENSVYLQYRMLGYQVYVGTIGAREVDFVVEKDGQRQYVQVTYLLADETVRKREFGALTQIKDHYPKIVVSLDDMSFGDYMGITHLRPWEL